MKHSVLDAYGGAPVRATVTAFYAETRLRVKLRRALLPRRAEGPWELQGEHGAVIDVAPHSQVASHRACPRAARHETRARSPCIRLGRMSRRGRGLEELLLPFERDAAAAVADAEHHD